MGYCWGGGTAGASRRARGPRGAAPLPGLGLCAPCGQQGVNLPPLRKRGAVPLRLSPPSAIRASGWCDVTGRQSAEARGERKARWGGGRRRGRNVPSAEEGRGSSASRGGASPEGRDFP